MAAAPPPVAGGLYLRWEELVYDVSLPRDSGNAAPGGGGVDGLPPLTKRVLHRVSGQLCPGGLLAVMGPSGSGKTSLIKILAGRRAPTSGSLCVNGVTLSPVPFRNASGFVAQTTVFLDTLTVRRCRIGARRSCPYVRSYNAPVCPSSADKQRARAPAPRLPRCGRRSCAPPCCAWSAA
jgi:hypothetical protein